MTFLNPSFLWVLPAAAVPVILHFLHRRPPTKVMFSHLPWLLEVHKATMPRKRLRDVFLMIMRTLLLLLLVLFFSRPVVESGRLFAGDSQNETTVLLLDVSASMGAVDGGRNALDWAQQRLQEILRKMPAATKCALITYSDRVEQELAPTTDRSHVVNTIQSAKVMPRSTDVTPALTLAYAMLVNQPAGRKTIVVASDQANHGWINAVEKQGHWDNYDPDVRVVVWEAISQTPNVGVSEAVLRLSEEGFLKGQATLHRMPTGLSPTWTLRLQNRVVAQAQVGSSNVVPLKANVPGGGYYAGWFEVAPDAASFDDVAYFAGRVPKGFRMLIVDGESGLAPSDSEAYYLQSALESPRDPRLESIHVIRPETLNSEILDNYDVIVMANVGPAGTKQPDIDAWVQRGGGLFLTAGSKWPKNDPGYLRYFRMKGRQAAGETVKAPSDSSLLGITELERFQWDQVLVNEHVILEADPSATVFLTLAGGNPLLVRKSVGRGAVLCLTSTLDRTWNNLPAKPIFAPLMRELVAALADPLRDQSTLTGFVGEPLRVRVPAGVRSVSVIAPDGVVSGANVSKDEIMDVQAPTLPGLYQVKTDRKETDFQFAVNIARLGREGDLTRVADKTVRSAFPNAPVDVLIDKDKKMDALTNALQGRDLTNALLICLFLLFAAETVLGWPRKVSA